MQHRQTTMSVEGRRDGRRSIARTLPGLSRWVGGSRTGDVSVHLTPVSQATMPPLPLHFVPRSVQLRPRTYIHAREHRDGPFTIDTIVAASWPSPLRRRSLVSSTDSICPPRGCLITGRRVDRGRARQKGRSSAGRSESGTNDKEEEDEWRASARPREKRDGETKRVDGEEGGGGTGGGRGESPLELRAHH